jgi:hypothetical protein
MNMSTDYSLEVSTKTYRKTKMVASDINTTPPWHRLIYGSIGFLAFLSTYKKINISKNVLLNICFIIKLILCLIIYIYVF